MRLSEKYAVPLELALLYDFVNTLDCRRYIEQGLIHSGGDQLATPHQMPASDADAAADSRERAFPAYVVLTAIFFP